MAQSSFSFVLFSMEDGWREKSSRMCWRDRGSFALSSYELRASRDWTRNLIELYKMEDDQICILNLIVTFMSYI